MWPKLWNSKLFQILLSAVASIILVFLAQDLVSTREDAATLKAEFEKRPTYEYVDKQDEQTLNYVKQHVEESNRANQTQLDLIRSIDSKINILLNKSK
jgi:hypothetical protein